MAYRMVKIVTSPVFDWSTYARQTDGRW